MTDDIEDDEPVGAIPANLYPIRTVASLTGINPITLRAWERRYGLIQPTRTEGGHRLYTREDIERIQHVLVLLEQGVAIGRVREALAAEGAIDRDEADPWLPHRRRMLAAVAQFDEFALEDCYNEVLSVYPVDMATSRLIVPLLKDLGERWQRNPAGVAEEHFFSTYLRNKLGARFHHRLGRNTGPRLLAACIPGEQHEIGLLLFALSAHAQNFQVVLLGANLPLSELPVAAQRSNSAAIVLSITVAPRPGLIAAELPGVVTGAGVPVFVGGAGAAGVRDELVGAGVQVLGADIGPALRQLTRQLSPTAGGTSS